jgi:HK97 family phage prohead protease
MRTLPDWTQGTITRRGSVRVKASTYDVDARTVDAVLSKGSPVQREYGTEKLEISPAAVDLGRVRNGTGVPLLDSHNQWGIENALGRVSEAWFEGDALVGRLSFHDTAAGRQAEGMVARGEITGVSAGYKVNRWEVTDDDGNVIDPERIRWNDDGQLTFTAKRWELLESSLVTVPADAEALIRSAKNSPPLFSRAQPDRRCLVRAACYRQQAEHYEKKRDHVRADRFKQLALQWEGFPTCR